MLGILSAILLMNLIAFLSFGFDKFQARHKRQRISERTLLLLAVCGGWIGAKAGQHFFSHKTHKLPFKSWLNAIAFLYAIGGSVWLTWKIVL